MNWYEEFEALTDKDKQTFEEVANLLFSKTFLVYSRDEDRAHYRFVERNLGIFQGYFSLAKWQLYQDKALAVMQLYNTLEINRRRFNLQETLFLFILRLLYDEKQQELRLSQQVMISGHEFTAKYMALQIKNRLPARDDLQRILRLFSRYSLLDLKNGAWAESDAVFVLHPSLLLVLNTPNVITFTDWLSESAMEGGEENYADVDADEID